MAAIHALFAFALAAPRRRFRFRYRPPRDPGRHHDRSVRFAVRLGRLQADQGAVKWRLRLDHQGFLPRFAVLTPGKTQEIEAW